MPRGASGAEADIRLGGPGALARVSITGMYRQLRGMVDLYLRGEEHGGTQAGEAR